MENFILIYCEEKNATIKELKIVLTYSLFYLDSPLPSFSLSLSFYVKKNDSFDSFLWGVYYMAEKNKQLQQ